MLGLTEEKSSRAIKLLLINLTVLFLVFSGPACKFGGSSSSGSDDSSSSVAPSEGEVTGQLLDENGNPIAGATVVIGANSPCDISDDNGNFRIKDRVVNGTHPFYVVTDGFRTLDGAAVVVNGNVSVGKVKIEGIKDVGNAPHFSDFLAIVENNKVKVTATIDKGADELVDIRAEMLSYGVGAVLTKQGDVYKGEFDLPAEAGGPRAIIMGFARDADNRISTAADITNEFTGAGGSYALQTINGTYSGSIGFHPRDKDRGFEHRGNAKLVFNNGDATGTYVEPNYALLVKHNGSVEPFKQKTSSDGKVQLIDALKGFYRVVLFDGDEDRRVKMLGKLNSATNPTDFYGLTRVFDKSKNKFYGGRFHLKNNASFEWGIGDMAKAWTISNFLPEDEGNSNSISGTYKPPFQYNVAVNVEAGVVLAGNCTLGTTVLSGSYIVLDSTLGKYQGTLTMSDGATFTYWFIVGFKKMAMFGVKKIVSGAITAYGINWGHKREVGQDWFKTAYLKGWFFGYYKITSGPNIGSIGLMHFKMNENGEVLTGKVGTIISSVTGGSLSFTGTNSTYTGQLAGTLTGNSATFTIAPASSRNASMGVYLQRLLGDFSDSSGNSGYFFTHRVHKSN
ncbi:MAG: carboxypeptidase regulatory-like domain-containing protein [Planctomycetes bacterium]|nr:carboxypeptidase regulatory-like domain-containing protein [Planctomycetota bacterium]